MEKILIVDENTENLYMLEVLLKGKGFSVLSASNGLETLKLAQEQIPDLIISDILMPVMDGFTLCRKWKDDPNLKYVPFVFYTATYTDPKDEKLAISLGADRFVVKPKAPDEFMRIIQDVVETRDKKLVPTHKPTEKEPVLLKEYNEALIRKLESKMVQLGKTNESLNNEIRERKQAENELRESRSSNRISRSFLCLGIRPMSSPTGVFLKATSTSFRNLSRSIPWPEKCARCWMKQEDKTAQCFYWKESNYHVDPGMEDLQPRRQKAGHCYQRTPRPALAGDFGPGRLQGRNLYLNPRVGD